MSFNVYSYRIDLDEHEYQQLLNFIIKNKKDEEFFNEILFKKIQNPKKIKYSGKKALAAETATEARSKKAKEKIINAINILRMENKKITTYAVAQEAKVSYNTVKKYLK